MLLAREPTDGLFWGIFPSGQEKREEKYLKRTDTHRHGIIKTFAGVAKTTPRPTGGWDLDSRFDDDEGDDDVARFIVC